MGSSLLEQWSVSKPPVKRGLFLFSRPMETKYKEETLEINPAKIRNEAINKLLTKMEQMLDENENYMVRLIHEVKTANQKEEADV